MTLLFCALILCVPFVTAASLPSFNDTCIHTLDGSDSPSSNHTRTLWNILLSCGLTLFACTWSAIHTNVPGMDEGIVTITSRRLFIMIMALIAPELMITWATRQFFSARAAAKEFNDAFGAPLGQAHDNYGDVALCSNMAEGSERPNTPKPAKFRRWTAAHGFFAWMGGFMLYVEDEPRGTLHPDELWRFIHAGSVDMPVISRAEIEDRSKGDGLSKFIALLQLAWFFVQFFARYTQSLPITLLEIDTLAVAALTCVAYGLWWKKPKDVGCPYIIHWKAANQPSPMAYEVATIHRLNLRGLIYPIVSLMGITAHISPSAARFRRVPSLGGYAWHHGKIVLLIGCFSGMIFGAIHFLGWNYLFQSHTEHILWRAACLGVACAPVLLFLDVGLILWVRTSHMSRRHSIIIEFSGIITSFLYIAARVTLIVLMILSLLSPPPGIYDTVAWTELIPHL